MTSIQFSRLKLELILGVSQKSECLSIFFKTNGLIKNDSSLIAMNINLHKIENRSRLRKLVKHYYYYYLLLINGKLLSNGILNLSLVSTGRYIEIFWFKLHSQKFSFTSAVWDFKWTNLKGGN